MRLLKHALLAAALALAVLVAAPSATLAAYSDAWGDIDMSSISINFIGSGSGSHQYETFAQAGVITDSNSGDAPGFEAYAEVDPVSYWGWGLVDDTDLYANAFVEGSGVFDGLAYGDAGFSGQWSADSAGTLTISFDYYLAYDVATGANESAYADVEALLTIGDQSLSDLLSIEAFNGMMFDEETPWYTLSLDYEMLSAQTVDFSALVSAQAEVATVPVPAAVWLLGSGLIGLYGIHRKRCK